ncbi:hypothetical protein HYN43_024070 [Mucilaginibacter celer]|uniref:Uncharacterized protein n=1 Tax=Mucilaginibacter celer TaxID=2305508 RepID=A0A494VXG7_9SPHI|nr:hypothetical protein HYN43_024070 [Mucilaginibacter celer]
MDNSKIRAATRTHHIRQRRKNFWRFLAFLSFGRHFIQKIPPKNLPRVFHNYPVYNFPIKAIQPIKKSV